MSDRSASRGRGGGKGKSEKGKIVRWHADRGFGFITPDDGGEDVFLHASCFGGGDVDIEGEEVWFEQEWEDRKGKYRASKVDFCDKDAPRPMRGGGGRGGGRDRYDDRRGGRDRSYSRGRGGGRGGYDRDRGHDRRRSRSRGYDDRRGRDRDDDRRGGGRDRDRDRD